MPEDAPDRTNSWVVPLAVERVSTQDDKELVGAEQIKALLEDDELPWHGELVVETGDSRYSKPEYLHAAHEDHPNLISVVRARGNRTHSITIWSHLRKIRLTAPNTRGKLSNCPMLTLIPRQMKR